jgi:hypothetical protein
VDVTVCNQGSLTECSNAVTLDFNTAPAAPADDQGRPDDEVLAFE